MAVDEGSGQYLQNLLGNSLIASFFHDNSQATLIVAVLAGVLIPLLLALAIGSRNGKKVKERAVTVNVGGEPGIAKRNKRFQALLGTAKDGATTLAEIFEQACVEHASSPFLGTRMLLKAEMVKGKDGRSFEKLTLGKYVWTTFGQAFERSCNFASGLLAIGHKKGERLAIFAETREEWQIVLQACFRQNFCVVTLYATLGADAIINSLNETEATTIICERKQLKKLRELSKQLESLKHVVYMEDQLDKSEPKISDAERDWKVVSFSHVEHLGGTAPLEAELPAPDDIAIIMYTSGSTALPKGVMISHANMVAVTASVIVLVPGLDATDTYLAYLPLAHALELAAEMASCMKGVAIGYGSPLTLTNTSSKIKKGTNGDLSELRPTLLTTVPAILDRMRDATRQMVDAKGGLSKHLYDLAYGRRLAAIEGSWFGAWGFEKLLWDVLIFGKVRQMIGGRVRGVISGGAPLSHDAQRFVNVCFGVPIVQGYGLTETAAGSTFSEWDDTSVGRVGPPMPHCYIKLVNWEEGGYLTTDEPMPRGEVVIGGLNITKGYFKNQSKTDESYKVDERGLQWFYTGDIGRFHPDGCLEIVDRKKDIVKLQHGEYISLGKVEAVMSVSPYVDIIMLHADPFHSHCVALIVPSRMALETWAKKTNLNYEDFPDLCQKNEVVHEVLKSLLEVGNQAKLHRFEIPTRVKLFPETWTPESGLVTDSLKIKREKIRKVYADALQDLYKS